MDNIQEIRISGYKGLENFEATNFKKINYIIGASGAGKSSLWELVTILSRGMFNSGTAIEVYGDLRRLMPNGATASIVFSDQDNGSRTFDYVIEAKAVSTAEVNQTPTGTNFMIAYLSTEQKETSYGILKLRVSAQYDITKYGGHIEDALFMLQEDQGDIASFNLVHFTNSDSANQPAVLRGNGRDLIMSTSSLSGGHSSLASLMAAIENNYGSIIVVEEPENGMHTDLQKSLHGIFKKFIQKHPDSQLFVITHSPFLLSSVASEDSQTNTYLMHNGKMLKPEGYDAKGAKYLSSKLVGISFEDIAPSKIVVSEGSLSTLLSIMNDRFYSCSMMFTTAKSRMGNEASGDDDLLTLDETEMIVGNRFNFFDKANLILIIDKPNLAQKSTEKRIEKLKEKDTNIVVLSEEALENFYIKLERLNIETKEFVFDIKNTKRERAERLAREITQEEFEDVFKELMFIFDE
ncbi:MAG: AAA family ATPase [Patescibacteria group bacterium]